MSCTSPQTSAAHSGASRSQNWYDPGHPWYYLLGGKVPGPKSILKSVIARDYLGHIDEIKDAEALCEPKRSEQLRRLRNRITNQYKVDLERYRELARELQQKRLSDAPQDDVNRCESVHTSLALKHNHIYNDLAHLRCINAALSVQRDLFNGL
ncbi:hypothetical protein [Ponticaulis sp.]|uniref:hypothetical protein n=1 Tax=Ponticaulis sp. TaxID=2020902 RepID=UPI000FF54BC3|nr:hypothetical protein [Ponticaulis sp.]RPG18472.1 MAG: hypothetical protein CBC85_001785 [Hyphomonadaceae bacterium TMED125]|tara:strand:- start:23666 stop:24124 length:459 start_codon:yes stop_codon:yes gene_type:complete